MDTQGDLFIGRVVDPQTGQTTEDPLLYDPDDLTTHGVVVGMTGSGKTGLCIDLLEDAALNQIPAIMIDPKGDITNTLLHFPELLPSDFEPWINPDEARRQDKTIEQVAVETAAMWRSGLEGWNIGPERIAALKSAAHFAIYTPGADDGLPVSILASLKAPEIPWENNKQIIRERISDTVTALLGLIGIKDIDPVRSREHILLSNIFEDTWSRGADLTLPELIMQVQNPPFEKLGVFDVATLFPDKERLELAMNLNNILAAPAFQSWVEGDPLEIGQMLFHPDGKPRHSVFYIAHLAEAERMFFVALLFSAIESWMRSQPGSTSLRALVYFDEIFGYLPPIGNPPSKQPMLRLLKQARAFGVGLLLATQNPVDVDYKALSNAGTWFVGRLGTEQDKDRLLDGLSTAIGGGMDRKEYNDLISRLGKRVFLIRNVHEKQPSLFQTRWAMNYLAGPLTRTQIPALNALAGAYPVSAALPQSGKAAAAATEPKAGTPTPRASSDATTVLGSQTRPQVPSNVEEYWLRQNMDLDEALSTSQRTLPVNAEYIGLLYRPTLLAQATIRFQNRKYNLDTDVQRTVLVSDVDRRGRIEWEDHELQAFSDDMLDRGPARDARYSSLDAPLSDARALNAAESDFQDWAYRTTQVTVRANEKLKVYAGPTVSEAEFQSMIDSAKRDALKTKVDKVVATYTRKSERIEDRLKREEQELAEDKAELSSRQTEEMGTHLETILGFLGKRRRSLSSSFSKRRMTQKARADVKESEESIKEYAEQLQEMEEEQARAVANLEEEWADIAAEVTEISVSPYKKDTDVTMFGVAWFPNHVVDAEGRILEFPAFRSE